MTEDSRPVVRAQAVVIGGGVIGCAVLRSLATRGIEAILLEAAPDICEGASKANSAIVHTGFDATAGTMEARLLRRSAELWPELTAELSVPYLEVGALMVARTRDDEARLRTHYAADAAALGVETELIDHAALRSLAPYITTDAVAALHIPREGVIDPFWLTRAYAGAAIALGAEVWTDAAVSAIRVGPGDVDVELADGRRLRADQVFDCAGLWADEIAALAGDQTFTLTPRKGQFLVSEETCGVDRIVLPIPGPLGKGMLVTPIVFGGVLLGPTAEDGHDKRDRSTDDIGERRIRASCEALVPDVARMEPIRRFAGVRAVSSTGAYVVRPSSVGDRLYLVAGIRSTGISASPAIAEAAVTDALERRGWSPRPRRPGPAPQPTWAEDAGVVVCPCRSVSDAEVAAALQTAPVPRTVDGLKRRCGVGFGDCQGNLCQAEVIERLARAHGSSPETVRRGAPGSWIVEPAAPAGAPLGGLDHDARGHRGQAPEARGAEVASDLAVVGGGFSGIGAALAAADAGLRVIVIDRGATPGGGLAAVLQDVATDAERSALDALRRAVARGNVVWLPATTVADLAPTGAGWAVGAHGEMGASTIHTARVVLATGGYVMPREHLRIDGPRPSGVMTADFALAALHRGWRPGRRAVVVGDGRLAAATASALGSAGVEIVGRVTTQVGSAAAMDQDGARTPFEIEAVRGVARLEAVLVSGRWIPADTLVLARALRPATFLLRGLGIGDDRPGVPAPAAGDGRLPLPDLWATGTCVAPDVDHAGSLAAGSEVGRAIAGLVEAGAAGMAGSAGGDRMAAP